MKLSDFYKKAITIGMDNDPRGRDLVRKDLEFRKAECSGFKRVSRG